MGCTPVFLLLAGLTVVIALTSNETFPSIQTDPVISKKIDQITTEAHINATNRKGRQIQIDRIEIPVGATKAKRQIIKIPGQISKVKLIRPPLNLRHNRAPQQFKRFHPSQSRKRPIQKKPQYNNDYDYDSEEEEYSKGKKVKRTLKKPIIREVTAEEFYEDEDGEYDHELRHGGPKKFRQYRSSPKSNKYRKKFPKQIQYSQYYETKALTPGSISEEDDEKEFNLRNRYKASPSENYYDYDTAASTIHMKQIPAPNLFGAKITNPPVMTVKHPYPIEKPILGKAQDENYIPGLNIKKLPTKGRQIQSIFSQQYTTHNPHVTSNLGLAGFGDFNGFRYVPKGSYLEGTRYGHTSTVGKFTQPTVASSDQVVTTLPVLTRGIHVIQPPQFRDVTVGHPSNPSRLISSSPQTEEHPGQRATIRDILEQDCPLHEVKGYCESPPRYPTQQISNIVKKCPTLMEVMNVPAFEEPQELLGIDNKTLTPDFGPEKASLQWSRSANEVATACQSDLMVAEPGYAREVTTGRWFVVVQQPDITIQRITTDTCRNPGKSCAGLANLKCTKANGLPNKSTSCVQRYSYQRLISWDPETPDGCPRIRIFRFPTACICHLGGI